MARSLIPIVMAPALLLAAPAQSSSLQIGPTRLQMVGAERTTTLTIRNPDSAPTNIQVRVFDWKQVGGADHYAPSTALLASPPQATLAPGQAQVIRVVAEALPAGGGERAFRLVIDQIPNDQGPSGAGVRTAIRVLAPVFITPSTKDRPKLRWEARRTAGGVLLTAINDGIAHDRLVAAKVTAGGKPASEPIEGYILGKARRSWTLPDVPAAAPSLRLSGQGDFGQVEADVPIAR